MSSPSLISIIIPCRNEGKFIGPCLDSIIANDFPKDRLEVLVVDALSEDGTREAVAERAAGHEFIRLLDNPRKITPAALNTGIRAARGHIIMRMDAHTTYDFEYISKCVRALEQYGVDNVGGVWKIVPRDATLIGQSIRCCLTHRFGMGNAHYRLAGRREPMLVDTVPFFCYRRDVFDRIGLFNEDLARGQDMEFNCRLKKAGGKTLLVPDIVSRYYARSDLRSFSKHNWRNGVWAILPFLYSPVVPVRLRHLVPLLFALALSGTALLGLLWRPGAWAFVALVGIYGLANLAASIDVVRKERDIRYLLTMPVVFAALHLEYGFGSLWGVLWACGLLAARRLRRARAEAQPDETARHIAPWPGLTSTPKL